MADRIASHSSHALRVSLGLQPLRMTAHEAGQRDDALAHSDSDVGRIDIGCPNPVDRSTLDVELTVINTASSARD